MKVVLQRVSASSVSIDGEIVGQIGRGINLLVGVAATDTDAEIAWLVNKCLNLRIFPASETESKWDKSVLEIAGEILVVSQFTLYGDCRKGRRPSFSQSASPDLAKPIYDRFVAKIKESGLTVATGKFGAMMDVAIENDGPVTLILERNAENTSR